MREQRKLKLKLAPIVEEDEVLIEEKILKARTLKIREEIISCEKYKNNLLESVYQVSREAQIRYQPSCKSGNVGGRREKEKLLLLCHSQSNATHSRNGRNRCKFMKNKNRCKQTFFKNQRGHIKIPMGNRK